jgi:hypothetical protein
MSCFGGGHGSGGISFSDEVSDPEDHVMFENFLEKQGNLN